MIDCARHIGSFEAFAVFGLGGLLVPLIGLLAWFKRGAYF